MPTPSSRPFVHSLPRLRNILTILSRSEGNRLLPADSFPLLLRVRESPTIAFVRASMDILCQSNLSFLLRSFFVFPSIFLLERNSNCIFFFFFNSYGSLRIKFFYCDTVLDSFKVDLNRARISNMIYPLELFFFFNVIGSFSKEEITRDNRGLFSSR